MMREDSHKVNSERERDELVIDAISAFKEYFVKREKVAEW